MVENQEYFDACVTECAYIIISLYMYVFREGCE